MNEPAIRVWVEELESPSVLRFTWEAPADAAPDGIDPRDEILTLLAETAGIARADKDDEAIVVEIVPGDVNRYDIASVIRSALSPPVYDPEPRQTVRVWAEDLSPTRLRLTWLNVDATDRQDARAERRRVAAHLLAERGIRSASPGNEGVAVEYDVEELDRAGLGRVVRAGVQVTAPLRERVDGLTRRATTYGNLGRKLALDDRISPIPGAAKQAASSRGAAGPSGNAVSRTALKFVPGATLISRAQTLLPVLTELSKWSRESDPEIVEAHLQSVGLDRATLKRDTITAHEVRFYAQDVAAEAASSLGARATTGAKRAIVAGRDLLSTVKTSMASQAGEPAEAETSGNESTDSSNELEECGES